MPEVNQYVSEPTMTVPVGMIVMYAGGNLPGTAFIPAGWLACLGQTLQSTSYPALFSVLQYTYGGSGSSFLLPSFITKVAVGSGGTAVGALTGTNAAGVGITEAGLGRATGSTGGHTSVQLTAAQSGLRKHYHTVLDGYRSVGVNLGTGGEAVNTNTQSENNGTYGGSAAQMSDTGDADAASTHENMMPYMALHYIIKAY
jgi:microcystin-dependent protein